VELSDFADWGEVAALFAPLYDAARRPGPHLLHAEIDRIAAISPDPMVRIGHALALVQGAVAYRYVALNEGNLRPAGAVWAAKAGDCKGKSALLLALLDGLGIRAEPALSA
jgi:transglutaminase-like putative cysteine protease